MPSRAGVLCARTRVLASRFILDGDDSAIGRAAVTARGRAQQAMVDGELGPANMPAAERSAVERILAEIFPQGHEGRAHIDHLLTYRTWAGAANSAATAGRQECN